MGSYLPERTSADVQSDDAHVKKTKTEVRDQNQCEIDYFAQSNVVKPGRNLTYPESC